MATSTYPASRPVAPMDKLQRDAALIPFFPPRERKPAARALLASLKQALQSKSSS